MKKEIELYRDINDNCNTLLALLKAEKESYETAGGRVKIQCKWLKEQVAAKASCFPSGYIYTLTTLGSEHMLSHLASEPQYHWQEVGIVLSRLLHACDGKLGYKTAYQPMTIYYIDKLIATLQNATRDLNQFESALIGELQQLKIGLIGKTIDPPLGAVMPTYPNLCEVDVYDSSIADLPNGELLIQQIEDLIFNGVRPDSWLTPEDAERETLALLG